MMKNTSIPQMALKKKTWIPQILTGHLSGGGNRQRMKLLSYRCYATVHINMLCYRTYQYVGLQYILICYVTAHINMSCYGTYWYLILQNILCRLKKYLMMPCNTTFDNVHCQMTFGCEHVKPEYRLKAVVYCSIHLNESGEILLGDGELSTAIKLVSSTWPR